MLLLGSTEISIEQTESLLVTIERCGVARVQAIFEVEVYWKVVP